MSDNLAKKSFKFLFCTSALTQRNLTSVGLVIIFFFVYVLAGGKISTDLPSLREVKNSNMGLGGSGNSLISNKKRDNNQLLGLEPSEERRQIERNKQQRGNLFADSSEAEKGGSSFFSKNKKRNIFKDQEQEASRKQNDRLSSIEERLNMRR